MESKNKLTRLILRYASEKLPKEKRSAILRKLKKKLFNFKISMLFYNFENCYDAQ